MYSIFISALASSSFSNTISSSFAYVAIAIFVIIPSFSRALSISVLVTSYVSVNVFVSFISKTSISSSISSISSATNIFFNVTVPVFFTVIVYNILSPISAFSGVISSSLGCIFAVLYISKSSFLNVSTVSSSSSFSSSPYFTIAVFVIFSKLSTSSCVTSYAASIVNAVPAGNSLIITWFVSLSIVTLLSDSSGLANSTGNKSVIIKLFAL